MKIVKFVIKWQSFRVNPFLNIKILNHGWGFILAYFDGQVGGHLALGIINKARDSGAIVLFVFAVFNYFIKDFLVVFVGEHPHSFVSVP